MELNHVLAQRLALLMEQRPRLDTQLKLESASGVGKSTLQRILNAEVNTDLDKLQKIAKAFSIEPFELLAPLPECEGASSQDHAGITYSGGLGPEDYTERELLIAWRELDDEDKAKVTAFMDALASIENLKIAQARKVQEAGKLPAAIARRVQEKDVKLTQQSNRDKNGSTGSTKKRKGV